MEKEHPLKIGLEIHGYLNTKEKLFCKCSTEESSKPNTNICPICTGQPGSKPMNPNEEAVKKIIQIALIFNSKISTEMVWQRKHYNWPDLPKGYQNTISGSHSTFSAKKGSFKGINITEIHLEEDPAQWNPETGHINYNRSGLPLVEIVTEPEFKSQEQVIEWIKSLIHHLSYLKAIRKNAGIKVDVNISTYGERVEIKNLNSLEKIQKAIKYEIARQLELHNNNEEIQRETRTYNENLGKTIKMRDKENMQDYRFIQDPDLPIIKITKEKIEQIKSKIPEMPEEKLKKLITQYKIDEKNAKILTKNLELVEFVEKLAKEKINLSQDIHWITIELLRILNYNHKTLDDPEIDIKPEHIAELIEQINSKKITPLKAKQIMNEFIPKSFSIKNLKEIDKIDNQVLENFVQQAIDQNPHAVEEYLQGKTQALNYLMGQVMKISKRRADPNKTKELLKKILDKE